MPPDSPEEYIAFVLYLRRTSDGVWNLTVDQKDGKQAYALVPITLVVRLWRARVGGILRGAIRLHDSDRWAPIQSNGQLEELIRA